MQNNYTHQKLPKPKAKATKEAKARYDKNRRTSIITLPPLDQPLALAWLSSPRPQIGNLDD